MSPAAKISGALVCRYSSTKTPRSIFSPARSASSILGFTPIQAGLAFLMTLVQGAGPPTSILPGINRVTGITLGLTVLCLVSILLLPAPKPGESKSSW